jgi:hypothetical protein
MGTENPEIQVLPDVKMTAELSDAVSKALSATDIRVLLIAEAEKQMAEKNQLDAAQAVATQAATDKAAADAAVLAAAQAEPEIFKRTSVIGGQEFHFEANTEAELDRQELNALKVAYTLKANAPAQEVVPDAAAVAAAQAAEVAAKAELERKFRLNEISAADYITQSGAVKAYLESQGVSIEALKERTEESIGKKLEQSWKDAGEEFQRVTPSWAGGDRNFQILQLQIQAMDLLDAPNKVEAIQKAYAEMQKAGLYFPEGDAVVAAAAPDANAGAAKAAADAAAADAAAAQAIATARAASAAAVVEKARSMSSSLFGQSSGTSGAPVVSPAVVAAKAVIPANATPEEILAAYHAEQVAQGKDPNQVFLESHRGSAIR